METLGARYRPAMTQRPLFPYFKTSIEIIRLAARGRRRSGRTPVDDISEQRYCQDRCKTLLPRLQVTQAEALATSCARGQAVARRRALLESLAKATTTGHSCVGFGP